MAVVVAVAAFLAPLLRPVRPVGLVRVQPRSCLLTGPARHRPVASYIETSALRQPAHASSHRPERMAERPPVNKWVVAGTVMIGTIMAVLDSSIVNVALPDMRGTLGATVDEITWVVTGYILSNVIIMPIVGMLSSRFGRKNFYLFSIASFTIASMACGLSHTLGAIVVWRIIQGIGARPAQPAPACD